MKHYVFDTEQDAQNYDNEVTAIKNYNGNKTSNWANPRKHPSQNKWAILANPILELEDQTPVELTEDWTPTQID